MKRYIPVFIAFMVMVVSVNQAIAIPQSAGHQNGGQKKIAFVVGNSKYKDMAQLPAALNDARDIDSVLKTAGYQTILLLDKSLAVFKDSLNELGKRMTKETTCIFYYAGHAAEYLNQNYLYFENSSPQSVDDLAVQTFNFTGLLDKLEIKKVKTRIIILDCCRLNPNKGDQVMIYGTNGLAEIKSPLTASYYIAYGSAPGTTSLEDDGKGRNGYFTAGILKYISNRNDTFEQVITKATKYVKDRSKNKQQPLRISTLDAEFKLYDQPGNEEGISSGKDVN